MRGSYRSGRRPFRAAIPLPLCRHPSYERDVRDRRDVRHGDWLPSGAKRLGPGGPPVRRGDPGCDWQRGKAAEEGASSLSLSSPFSLQIFSLIPKKQTPSRASFRRGRGGSKKRRGRKEEARGNSPHPFPHRNPVRSPDHGQLGLERRRDSPRSARGEGRVGGREQSDAAERWMERGPWKGEGERERARTHGILGPEPSSRQVKRPNWSWSTVQCSSGSRRVCSSAGAAAVPGPGRGLSRSPIPRRGGGIELS